jgi:cytidylate kinase
MRKMTLENLNRVILTLAHHGNVVIVGRGSYAVLGGFADVLNVRIQAPLNQRVRFIMEDEGIADWAEAEKILAERSAIRSGFVESTYQTPWDAASLFDLVINTGPVSPETAVAWIVDVMKSMETAETAVEESVRSRSVDPYVVSAVQAALDCERIH